MRRNVDLRLQIELRESASKTARLEVLDTFMERTQDFFGSPGSDSSIANRLGSLVQSITTLSATPESSTLRISAVNEAVKVAQQLNDLSTDIQALRSDADKDIADSVRVINEQLENIVNLNVEIAQQMAQDTPTGDMEDQRDLALDTISKHMSISYFTRETGEVVVYTPDGKVLADRQPNSLTHDAVAAMGPAVTHAGGSIQPIDLNGFDLTNLVQQGRIAGLVELRDTTLPNLQAEADRLAEMLRDQVNAVHNKGSEMPPRNSLSGTRTFVDPAVDSVTLTSAVRIAVVDGNGDFVSYYDLPAGAYTVNAIRDAINVNLGADATAATSAGGPLTISADNAANGIALVDLGSQTATFGAVTFESFSELFGLNDFFVTPGSVKGGSDIGLSATLEVHSDIAAAPGLIASGRMNSVTGAGAPVAGDTALTSGDNTVLTELSEKFDETMNFSAAGSLALTNTTLAGYGAEIVGNNSMDTAAVSATIAFETSLKEELTYRHRSISGVNLDEEMSNLILFQNAYSASARVVETVQRMFDILEQMTR